ncbi:hypothetical protein CN074_21580 [Sinorhizobium medicae]|uniref:Phage ABA sandwich domain-containing protein n=2 Tax=Sinorhizobium medicae TaxID=110321 RepID=A0A6G1WJJ3_9HYPH|nr:hypothetical protein [Sinorhizobium medicae]MDX0548995.1 hypothetical protein [Sinorhizobium medicae]MDX0555157.1 hypothetical protein [Sinorhizobium medicae]MDX0573602.1 hypothetical protein [Sinorhizobium medicae]MDX0672485.1 hypothetical protein [Sinorhizobium medicae]
MEVDILIARLESAEMGERAMDAAIGRLLGWRKKVEYVKRSDDGAAVKRTLWVVPAGNETGIVPQFTTSIDAAMLLVNEMAADGAGGVSWANGKGTAIIGDGPYCVAATPALALCIAALRAKKARVASGA